MKTRIAVALCLWAILAALEGAAAFGCTYPAVQGVIDWKKETKPFPKIDILQDFHGQRWDAAPWDPAGHAAIDSAIFMPPTAQKLGDNVTFRNLTVAALARDCSVSSVTVWYWADVNNNQIADNQDLVKVGGTQQECGWHPLIQLDEDIPTNRAFNLFSESPDKTWEDKLRSGMSYLLLIEVHAEVGYQQICSFIFASDTIDTSGFPDRIEIVDFTTPGCAWDTYGPEAYRYFDGLPYPSRVPDGIEDREILWIRINQPPPSPGPRGSGGR